MTASVALKEPDPYLAQAYRFGLLEDFDHLYRYSALYDRLEGKDPNYLIQSYSDIRPGRPTSVEHRHPLDDLRRPYDMRTAHPLTKIHALLITAAEFQTHDFYMNIGPMFADPVARQLYAEIASIEEQHVTQYGSLIDPDQTVLEQWLLHEAMELYCYYSCLQYEGNARIKDIWQRMVDYELGHLHYVMELFQRLEGQGPGRDPAGHAARPHRLQEPPRLRAPHAEPGGGSARQRHGVRGQGGAPAGAPLARLPGSAQLRGLAVARSRPRATSGLRAPS